MNCYHNVLPDTTNTCRGESPGDHCYEVCAIRRTRKHVFLLAIWHYPLVYIVTVGYTALPTGLQSRVTCRLAGSAI